MIVTDDQYPQATGSYETTNTMCCGEQSWYAGYLMSDGTAYNPTLEPVDDLALPNRNCFMLMENANARDQIVWRCSQTYTSTAYAQLMCPYRRSSCGPNKVINFYTD